VRLSCLARNGRSPGEESRSVRRCGSGDRGAAALRSDQAKRRQGGIARRTASSGEDVADISRRAQDVQLRGRRKRNAGVQKGGLPASKRQRTAVARRTIVFWSAEVVSADVDEVAIRAGGAQIKRGRRGILEVVKRLTKRRRTSSKNQNIVTISIPNARGRIAKLLINLVLPLRIELRTSPLPRECSTTELRQQTRRNLDFSAHVSRILSSCE
jgi:hypothetical protein